MSRQLRVALVAMAMALVTAGSLGPVTESAAASNTTPDPDAAVAYQQNPAHDGSSTDSSFVAPLTKAWSKSLGGLVSYPLIAGGRVFVVVDPGSGLSAEVEALSLSTGEVLWGPVSVGGSPHTGAIAYDSGRVFSINFGGRLTALDAATGAVVWTKQLAGQYAFSSPPTAVNGTVYVGGAGTGGTLYAVDEDTGVTRWTGSAGNGDHSSPAVDDTGVVVSYACEQVFKFGLTGSLVWHHRTECEGGGGRTPVLHDGKVYVRDSFTKAPAVLDASSGRQVAAFASDPAPAFQGDSMATVSQGDLTVSRASTGKTVWTTTGGDSVTAPLIANGYVIEGLNDGTVEARLVRNGDLAWSGQTGAEIMAPDEHNDLVLPGLAQGDGALVVPAGQTLSVFLPASEPEVTITDGPTSASYIAATATFRFKSAHSNAQYECAVDFGEPKPCTSPARFDHLTDGPHSFAASLAGSTIGPATRWFKADTIAPTVRVAPFASRHTTGRRVTAHWSATDARSGVATYQARVRRAPYAKPFAAWSVHSPSTARSTTFTVTRGARYCVSVRAKDEVGNWSRWSAAQCARRR